MDAKTFMAFVGKAVSLVCWFFRKIQVWRPAVNTEFECEVDRRIIEACVEHEKAVLVLQQEAIDTMRAWKFQMKFERRRITRKRELAKDRQIRREVLERIGASEVVVRMRVQSLLLERVKLGKSASWMEFRTTYFSRFGDVLGLKVE